MENRSKTLFVRNLPYTATNESLEKVFSDIGPVQKCFVVMEKGDQKCRGFGYVTYAIREDAEVALKQVQTLESRKLSISFANKKMRPSKKGEKSSQEEKIDKVAKKKPVQKVVTGEKALRRAQLTLVVTGFSRGASEEDVTTALQKHKKIVDVQYPAADNEEPTALARFKSKRDAVNAMKKIKKDKSAKLSVQLQSQLKAPSQSKKSRLIIRNLSFKASNEILKKDFSQFGEITDVQIPTKPGGKKFGYGFVQFSKLADAAAAVKGMNTKPILGRPVAVDWAVAKDKYQQQQAEQAADSLDEDSDTDDSGSHSSAEIAEEPSKKTKPKKKQKRKQDKDDFEGTGEEKSHKKRKQKETVEETEGKPSKKRKQKQLVEEEDSEEEDQPDSGDEDGDSSDGGFIDMTNYDDDDEDDEEMEERKSDISEGKTLFVRNLSFDTANDELKVAFEQYGPIAFCRVVINPDTERSTGVAFVKYKKADDVAKCLTATSANAEGGGLVLDGRSLVVSPAISREEAVEMKVKNKKKKEQERKTKDTRNLFLSREGMIRPGTEAAVGLSRGDLQKRMTVDMVKKQKLKNPNIFVSTTRLCVHNLPISTDDSKLRQKMLKVLNDKSAKIIECRVMRDLKNVNEKGVARSLGYAFVNFTEHKHALNALRKLNNNPEIYGDNKRLIVEFSLENRSALQAKAKRMERHQKKHDVLTKKDKRGDGTYTNRKLANKPKVKVGQVVKPDDEVTGRPQGMKALPTHWGPKIRHVKRGEKVAPKKPTDKKTRGQVKREKQRRREEDEPLKKSRKERQQGRPKRREDDDQFERMVQQYKSKLANAMSSQPKENQKKKTKWFTS